MRRNLIHLIAAAIAVIDFAPAALAAGGPSPVTTVILVRHAEKMATTMSSDVPLSPEGIARANELARVLADAGITAVYTTPYQRTRSTAAPLAAELGIQPIEIAAGKDYAKVMANTVRQENAGQTVLVVGHSNTTPDVMRKLGVPNVRDIADSEYDNLYIVTLSSSAPPKLLTLHYGAPAR